MERRAAGDRTMTRVDVLDIRVFHDLHDSLSRHPGALLEVYRKFFANAAAFIDALAGQNAAARIDTLHTLKGSAAMLGANRLAALAERLQVRLSTSTDRVTIDAGELANELAAFRRAIAAQFDALGSSTAL